MKHRITILLLAVLAALSLVMTTVALAANGTATMGADNDGGESLREQARARAAEAEGDSAIPRRRLDIAATPPITAPLFAGINNFEVFAQAIDPTTGANTPLFDGLEIWGAAYDWRNEVAYLVDGITLYAWPVSDAPIMLGTIRSAAPPNSPLAMVGLAFYDDTLYAARSAGSAAFPEGIYTIDVNTQEATLAFTYDIGATKADIGGLDVDPVTGILYGTNDDPDARGLVSLDMDGTVTVVAPYPGGQNDIDGLAIGNDGRAYLVPDRKGSIYIFDLVSGTYLPPIPNPWTTTTSEFSGAAWIAALSPSITLTKTAGLDPDVCALDSLLTILPGSDVTYCYMITNDGEIKLTRHDLDDSELGEILSEFEYDLLPGATVFLTETAVITQTTINTATWTAFNAGPTDIVTATAAATVTVAEPSIVLTKTVGLDPDVCATTTDLLVPPNAEVTYCYEVTNTGPFTLTEHTVADSELGTLLTDFAYDLGPSASVFITETATIASTTVNTATWTAYTSDPKVAATATAAARVAVVPMITVSPAQLTAVLSQSVTTTVPLTIGNEGTLPLTWTITEAAPNCQTPSAVSWLDVDPPAGTTLPGVTDTITVALDSTGLSGGAWIGSLCINSNDPEMPLVDVPVRLTVEVPDLIKVLMPVVTRPE